MSSKGPLSPPAVSWVAWGMKETALDFDRGHPILWRPCTPAALLHVQMATGWLTVTTCSSSEDEESSPEEEGEVVTSEAGEEESSLTKESSDDGGVASSDCCDKAPTHLKHLLWEPAQARCIGRLQPRQQFSSVTLP